MHHACAHRFTPHPLMSIAMMSLGLLLGAMTLGTALAQTPPANAQDPRPAPRERASPPPDELEPAVDTTRGAGAPTPAATPVPSATQRAGGNGAIQAPMQGMVVKVKVAPGDRVRLGDVVVILEAMKMQNDIVATVGGTVREVCAKEGAIVAPNEVLMTIG